MTTKLPGSAREGPGGYQRLVVGVARYINGRPIAYNDVVQARMIVVSGKSAAMKY